jgi:autotransporter translocation and assembly factor TamB
MSFADFALLIGGHSLAVDGTVGYDGKCNVSLVSERVPVDSIVRLARLPVTAAEDSFLTADIKLLGSLPFPSLAGALNLENGIFSFPYLEQKLYFPSLKVTNNRSGSSVKVSGLRWGDSPLELEGQILNEDSMGGGNLSINLSGKNLKATWAGSLLNNIDVSSQIRSTDLEQKADCKITIGDGTIRIPLSFLSSLGQSESVPKGVATENQLDATPSPEDKDSRSDFHTINPTMEELFASGARIFRSVATNLVIEISDSVRVQNAFFDTRVSGNASFSVSKQTPKFAINLNTIGGTLKIHRHTFNISTGTLLYEKLENQNRSALSLICYCRESDYNISLNVAGTFEEPTLSFSSVPPMAQAEIVKLLLLGKQQFAGGQDQGRTESSSNRLATGNVMEATAIDFLATGMLNSLLFTGMADMGTLSVRTDEDVSSYLRLEKKVGRDFLVTFEQLLNEKYDHTTTEDTNVYIKWGIDKDVTIEGKTGGSDDKTESGSYVGMFKNFHFR